MNIRLRPSNTQTLDISYGKEATLINELSYVFSSFFRLDWKQSIAEYHHRMHCSRKNWSDQSNSSAGIIGSSDRIESCVPSLEDLYTMQGNIDATEELKAKRGPSIYVFVLVSFFVSLELVLFFRMTNKIFSSGL